MAKVFLNPNDPLLLKTAEIIPVNKINSQETKNIIQKMLRVACGEQKDAKKPVMVGLAAPQIGISKRVILVDLKANGKGKVGKLKVFINPEIIWTSKKQGQWYEGCYSIPEICGIVSRPTSIKVAAFVHPGQAWEAKLTGYVARIFQHEIDHLNRKLFVDLIKNPDHLHRVKKEEFPLYRNKHAWRNWPKKYPIPLALGKLKKV